jgi:hypothetical protein
VLGFLLSVRDQLEIFLRLLLIRVARAQKAFTTISQPYVYFPASSHCYYPLRSIIPPLRLITHSVWARIGYRAPEVRLIEEIRTTTVRGEPLALVLQTTKTLD